MIFEYSEKERRLIEFFGLIDVYQRIDPHGLYRVMAEKAFCENIQGKEADSLRRCLKAINISKPYRMTQEWDAMINID